MFHSLERSEDVAGESCKQTEVIEVEQQAASSLRSNANLRMEQKRDVPALISWSCGPQTRDTWPEQAERQERKIIAAVFWPWCDADGVVRRPRASGECRGSGPDDSAGRSASGRAPPRL